MVSDQDTKSEIITHVQSNIWRQDAVTTKLFTVVPSICESLIRNMLHVTLWRLAF
jgi:predicted type IV restriction endonuclease